MSTQQQIDINEQVKAQTRVMEEMVSLSNEEFKKKKDYIIQFKEITRPLVLAGYYPDVELGDLCSFIGNKLKENNVEYSSGHLAELFDDDEKRTQHRPKNSPDRGVIDSPPLEETEQGIVVSIIGQLDFLEKQIGKSYDVMSDYAAADKLQTLENIASKQVSHIKTFEKKLKTAHWFVDAFEKQFGDVDQTEQIAKGLPKKQRERLQLLITIYHASDLLRSEMESDLIDITENEIKELQATQSMTSKDIDKRNKLSNWNKSMIVLAMKAANIAKNQCAKLCGIDKKHITNNIYPKESPTETHTKNKHHDYISWFDNITIKIGGKTHTFNIYRWYDEQIERRKLSLEFKPLVVATAKTE